MAEVPIESVGVSRSHAVVRYDDGGAGWRVVDLKSMNGVHVNGVEIEKGKEKKLVHGDTFSLGPNDDYKWTFVFMGKVGKKKREEEEEEATNETERSDNKRQKLNVAQNGTGANQVEVISSVDQPTTATTTAMATTTTTTTATATTTATTASVSKTSDVGSNDEVSKCELKTDNVEAPVLAQDIEGNAVAVKVVKDDVISVSQTSSVKAESAAQDVESEKASNVADRLRDRFAAELCCAVCSEVFITPMTLSGCGHVFCSLCIAKWKKKKRSDASFACPSCRVRMYVVSRLTPFCFWPISNADVEGNYYFSPQSTTLC